MADLSGKTIGYICYPYNASLDTGRGHDRYAYELIKAVGALGPQCRVWESDFGDTKGSGGLGTVIRGAAGEFVFPFKLAAQRADVFHATSPLGGKTAALIGKRPLVTSILDVIHLNIKEGFDLSFKYRFKRWCIGHSTRRSDRIVTLFESTRQALIETYRVPESRVATIPIGIDHKKFFPGPARPPTGKIVFLGEATRSKGLDTLIEAMPAVLRKCPHAELIAGSQGRDLPAMQSLAKSLGVAGHVKFVGFVPEDGIRDFYLQGDCAAFPSRYGFGLPTLEAMACGVPAIAGDTLDAPEFVGDAGILVKPGNVAALAEALVTLLADPKAHDAYAARGLARAREYTWEEMGRRNAQVYGDLLG
jgi:glycosyltransferase involved in cell wall biosynthesis